MTNPVVWFEVMGQDADKLRSFYGKLLGWKFKVDHEIMNYGVAETADGPVDGGIGQTPPGVQGWTTFYTKVNDLGAAVALACAPPSKRSKRRTMPSASAV